MDADPRPPEWFEKPDGPAAPRPCDRPMPTFENVIESGLSALDDAWAKCRATELFIETAAPKTREWNETIAKIQAAVKAVNEAKESLKESNETESN